MMPWQESEICIKLANIQTDVSETKESVARIEEKVLGQGDDITRHDEDIKDLTTSRNEHALLLKEIETEDSTKEKLKAIYTTKKQFRITRNMWITGLLVTALIATITWCFHLASTISS